MTTMTDRDFTVLRDLMTANAHGTEWARPLDIGGEDRSDHSYRLARLVKIGFVQSTDRPGQAMFRQSRLYRITDAGRAILKEHYHD